MKTDLMTKIDSYNVCFCYSGVNQELSNIVLTLLRVNEMLLQWISIKMYFSNLVIWKL